MSANGLFNDPAIIGLSSPTGTTNGDGSASKKSGLEPGSALSKLLDSAMANAAKEATPEPEVGPELNSGEPLPSKSNRSSFQSFVPKEKTDLSKIYSINALLDLRSSPAVLDFDVSRLPEPTFWRTRQKGPDGHAANGKNNNHNNSGNNSLGGTGKRSRRNNQLANAAAAAAAAASTDSLNWERKPAGFLRNSDIDNMSTEKISQLLGEAPEEETPDWDLPGSNADLRMDMGRTVEDFERWKLHMRQEERRKQGEIEPLHEAEEFTPSNEVDSFFSFAKPKEVVRDNSAFPFNKQTESKSSRFSSFFGGPGPTPEQTKPTLAEPEQPTSARRGLKEDHSGGNLRFFHGDTQQSPEIPQKPQERNSHGPPPGIQTKFQNFSAGPSQSPIATVHGMVPQANPPPGYRMNPGPPQGPGLMMGPGPRGPGTNDTFFLSLLNKSEVVPGTEGNIPLAAMFPPQGLPQGLPQGVPQGDAKVYERGPQYGRGAGGQDNFSEPQFPGPNSPNSQQPKPLQYLQYQDPQLGLPQQQMGMKGPPGMKPMAGPPGMYPPGMFPPGAPGLPNHQNSRAVSGGSQQGPQVQTGQGLPKPQMRGEMPPPWMRYGGPNGNPGIVPPGYGPAPPGFPPGFPQVPPNSQQPPGLQQAPPKHS